MSDTDLQYALMEAGRMNLMHLPPGAIAWLWDRPNKQVDAAESLAVAANAYGNPVVDASLLKADQNIMLIKCQGGECFRIYPDGGYSYEGTPMDIGGCSSVLQGMGDCGCPMDDHGHAMERIGNDEHMNDVDPHAEVQDPAGLTNLAGEPTQDKQIFDGVGEVDGPGTGDGMGTGSPYVGEVPDASAMLDNQMMSRELGEFRIKDLDQSDVDQLAESLCLTEWDDYDRYDRYDEAPPSPPEQVYVEVYDDATDDMKEVAINVAWEIQPTEYEGPHVFYQGGAVLQDMQLANPVQVNGRIYQRLNNELAALIMSTILQDEVEATPRAYEALREYIEEHEGEGIEPPVRRYPMTR